MSGKAEWIERRPWWDWDPTADLSDGDGMNSIKVGIKKAVGGGKNKL